MCADKELKNEWQNDVLTRSLPGTVWTLYKVCGGFRISYEQVKVVENDS